MLFQLTGHLGFIGTYEYFDRAGAVYLAPIDNPVMPDGYRCGRFECQMWAWIDGGHRARLVATFGESFPESA